MTPALRCLRRQTDICGQYDSLCEIAAKARFRLVGGDILNEAAIRDSLDEEEIDVLMHMTATSHVDRSIDGPEIFGETNAIGTSLFLKATRACWAGLTGDRKQGFRFQHVSTDVVFGDLPCDTRFQHELTAMIDGYLDNDSLWYPLGEARYTGERFGKIGS